MTEHIKQNASGLYLEIQKIGCFFRSALLLAEMQSGKKLTVKQINELWDAALNLRYIDQQHNVMNSAKIATLALEALKCPGRFIEIATFKDGCMNYYSGIENDKRRADYFIQKGLQNGPNKTHFYVVDKAGNLIEDPHEPAINITKVVYTICYRYDARK